MCVGYVRVCVLSEIIYSRRNGISIRVICPDAMMLSLKGTNSLEKDM